MIRAVTDVLVLDRIFASFNAWSSNSGNHPCVCHL